MRGKSRAVNQFHAPILRPRRLVIALGRGPFGAEAHRGELRFRDALEHQSAAYRLRASFAESDIVFAGTAFIGVALELDLEVRMAGQIARVSGHEIGELGLDLRFVEVEVNYLLCQRPVAAAPMPFAP